MRNNSYTAKTNFKFLTNIYKDIDSDNFNNYYLLGKVKNLSLFKYPTT